MSSGDNTAGANASLPWYRQLGIQAEAAWALYRRPERRHFMLGLDYPPVILATVCGGLCLGLILLAAIFDAAAANGARKLPGFIVSLFNEITDFGKSGWFLWPLALFLAVLALMQKSLSRPSQRVLAAIAVRAEFLFVAIAVPSLFVTILKRFIGRARPFVGGAADPYLFSPSAWTASYAGFPSGHATTAVAAAVAVGMIWPQARVVMWIYAALIMASRVIINAHYPTDVLAGALAGAAGVFLVQRYFAAKRRGFGIAPDGSIRQFPGPSWRRSKAVARDLLGD